MLLPHRTILSNLRASETTVLLELRHEYDAQPVIGQIIDLVFDATDAGRDELYLSDRPGLPIFWADVERVWTPTWTNLAFTDKPVHR